MPRGRPEVLTADIIAADQKVTDTHVPGIYTGFVTGDDIEQICPLSLDCSGTTSNVIDGKCNGLNALWCNNIVVNQRSSIGLELFFSYAHSLPDNYKAVKDRNMMGILTNGILRSFAEGNKAWASAPCLFPAV